MASFHYCHCGMPSDRPPDHPKPMCREHIVLHHEGLDRFLQAAVAALITDGASIATLVKAEIAFAKALDHYLAPFEAYVKARAKRERVSQQRIRDEACTKPIRESAWCLPDPVRGTALGHDRAYSVNFSDLAAEADESLEVE